MKNMNPARREMGSVITFLFSMVLFPRVMAVSSTCVNRDRHMVQIIFFISASAAHSFT
jgi:hypothetical protein